MWSIFTRLGEKIGVITPIPVLNNPETRQVSQAVSQTSQKVILQYQQALEKQQAVIENMEKENIKFSRIIAAISLSVGIIVGGAGISVVNQATPDNFVQKVSSKVAKLLGAETTGYDYMLENKQKDILLSEQKSTLDVYKKLVGAQGELLQAKDEHNNLLIQKFESLSSDIQDLKTSLGSYTSGKTITGKITPVENQTTPPQTKNVLEQVSGYIAALNQNKNGPYQLKLSQNEAGRVLVWIEGNGKKSLGYYADSPKYTQRLSLEGVRAWANQSIQDMEHIDRVYQIAQEKGIAKFGNQHQLFSILVQQQYAGGVKVILKDNATSKTISFTSNSHESHTTISNKIDTVTQGFLS